MRIAAIAVWLLPEAAWAHPGHHAFLSLHAYLAHLLSQPDHVAMIVAAGVGIVWIVRKARRRGARRRAD
jgi:hydrogenase/urease accessory protein HupE